MPRIEDFYDEAYYLAKNPDVAAAVSAGVFKSGRAHWELYGKGEPRDAYPAFDVAYYKEKNPDLADAGITTDAQLRLHWATYGLIEGREYSRPVPVASTVVDSPAAPQATVTSPAASTAPQSLSNDYQWIDTLATGAAKTKLLELAQKAQATANGAEAMVLKQMGKLLTSALVKDAAETALSTMSQRNIDINASTLSVLNGELYKIDNSNYPNYSSLFYSNLNANNGNGMLNTMVQVVNGAPGTPITGGLGIIPGGVSPLLYTSPTSDLKTAIETLSQSWGNVSANQPIVLAVGGKQYYLVDQNRDGHWTTDDLAIQIVGSSTYQPPSSGGGAI